MKVLWTDGSASPNPGPGGYAVIEVDSNEARPVVLGREKDTTNIRMEGLAMVAAIEYAGEDGCEIHSDSEFWINVLTKWAAGWKANGWKKKTGPIKNIDLVKKLYELYVSNDVKLVWEKGHDGIELNEMADENGEIPMYAIWIASAGNIQNWNGCGVLADGAVTALTDTRDNQVYAVAKLADGNCWMIENLRLNTAGSDDETKAQGFGGVFVGQANNETTGFNNTNPPTANSLYSPSASGSKMVIGTSNYPYNRIPRYNNTRTTTTWGGQGVYGYGNYYNWPAAVASTGYYATVNASVENTSICPTGWRLPKGGNRNNEANNDYWNLVVDSLNNGSRPENYNSDINPYYTGTETTPVFRLVKKYPNNFVRAGYYDNNAIADDSYGYYWTSTVSDSGSARFGFGSRSVFPGTRNSSRYSGFSVRCMIKNNN